MRQASIRPKKLTRFEGGACARHSGLEERKKTTNLLHACALIRKLVGRKWCGRFVILVDVLCAPRSWSFGVVHSPDISGLLLGQSSEITQKQVALLLRCKMVGALAFRPHSSRNRIRRRLPFSSLLHPSCFSARMRGNLRASFEFEFPPRVTFARLNFHQQSLLLKYIR